MSSDHTLPPESTEGRQDLAVMERLWLDAEQLIAGSHLFRSLDDEGRRDLLGRGRLVVFPSGSVIIREGEPGESFYVIDKGVVEVSTVGVEGGEVSLTTLQRGAFFGEVSLLTGSPRTATVVALTDVAALAFDRDVVETMLANHPKARRLLDAVVAGRARDAAEKIARAASVPPPPKAPEGG
jgi:CRP-like cAMP-binding protein